MGELNINDQDLEKQSEIIKGALWLFSDGSIARNNYIDVLKGLGIVMVIMGHCLSYTDNPLNKMILSFHMPLFYFISGLTIKRIKSVTEFRAFVKRKLINLQISAKQQVLLTKENNSW